MAEHRPPGLPDLRGRTVLVIDDDRDALDVLSMFLEACGAQVLVARNAAAGLAYIDTAARIDAIITDLAMPDLDGVEFARRLRRHPRRKLLPVIALTGFYETYPNSSEFDAWLRKPVNIEQLGGMLERFVRRGQSEP
jgi:CheY-like chemotaxis protein